MRLHRNATPKLRVLLVDRVTLQRWTQRSPSEAAGIRFRTVAKWIARLRAGDHDLLARLSRPYRMPWQLDVQTAAALLGLSHRRRISSGPRHQAGVLQMHRGLKRSESLWAVL